MSSSEIRVTPPYNLQEADLKWFPPRTYLSHDPKVREVQWAFLTHDGIVLDGLRLVRECLHHYPRTTFPHYFKALKTKISARIFRRAKLQTLDAAHRMVSIHHPWMNYYHWMLEFLPRLLQVRKQLDRLCLLLPEEYKHIGYIQDSLHAFAIPKIQYIPSGVHLLVPHLVVPELRPWGREFCPSELYELAQILISGLASQTARVQQIDRKVFITRSSAKKRKIRNEEELYPILEAYEFEIVDFSDMNLAQQIQICASTKYLVAQHGAALANILFLAPQAKVLELHKEPTHKHDFINDLYWHLASAKQIPYLYLICPAANPSEFFVEADIRVDSEKLCHALDTLLSS